MKLRLLFCAFIGLLAWNSRGQNIITYAGTLYGYSGDGGLATAAKLGDPFDVTVDKFGNVYIADADNNVIRKVSTSGIITTFAGKDTAGFSGDGGQATAAKLFNPQGVCVDTGGNVYIADHGNNRVRKVNTAGIITTIAGNGSGTYGGDLGPATAASMFLIGGIAMSNSGVLAIADLGNNRIRIVSSGIISTITGTGTAGFSGDGGSASLAQVDAPSGVAFDTAGNLFVADAGNHRVRKINTTGTITTVAGNGSFTYTGDGVPATSTAITDAKVDVDRAGNLYIADGLNNRIRMVNTSGIITTIAGSGSSGLFGDGGPATAARFSGSVGVKVDTSGGIYIVDQMNNRIRKVVPTPLAIEGPARGQLKIFPNPGSGQVTIEGPVTGADGEKVMIEVTDQNGKVMYSDDATVKNGWIDVIKHIPVSAGIYYLNIKSANGSEALKFIRNK